MKISTMKQRAAALTSGTVLTFSTTGLYAAQNDFLARGMKIISSGLVAFGAVWTIWGIVGLASGLNDHNGQDIKQGVLRAIGGVLISVAALWLTSIDFNFG